MKLSWRAMLPRIMRRGGFDARRAQKTRDGTRPPIGDRGKNAASKAWRNSIGESRNRAAEKSARARGEQNIKRGSTRRHRRRSPRGGRPFFHHLSQKRRARLLRFRSAAKNAYGFFFTEGCRKVGREFCGISFGGALMLRNAGPVIRGRNRWQGRKADSTNCQVDTRKPGAGFRGAVQHVWRLSAMGVHECLA